MRQQLLSVIMDGLIADPERAKRELESMGVQSGAIARLRELDADSASAFADRAVTGITLNFEALSAERTTAELMEAYLKAGASTELVVELLGVPVRQVRLHRAALGLGAAQGRPQVLDARSVEQARRYWRESSLPRARRLLFLHERLPMWTLISLYNAVRSL